MTDDQYYSNREEQKRDYINYSYLYSLEPPSYNSAERGKTPTTANIDDLVQPVWFEKIMKQLDTDKNRPQKSNRRKV